jgi:FAD/FMN-containing dehydrogenase
VSRRPAFRRVSIVAGFFTLVAAGVWPVVRSPSLAPDPPLTVNDVSGLNPIAVAAVLEPTTTQEIVDAVRRHAGPIAIGGARHSMGGQTATGGALFLDMRRFNRIVAFNAAARRITVQAGARWRDVQERVDAAGLSVAIMQSYADFTVGGSLSVNAHGRFVGVGPVIDSVERIELVLADGRVITASPSENADVFYAAIGGYGGVGVITEATLRLVENVKLKRSSVVLAIPDYPRHFASQVRPNRNVALHNGDIYPPSYDRMRAITYARSDEAVSVLSRLRDEEESSPVDRFAYWFVSTVPGGLAFRQRALDPWRYAGSVVTWRNYEMSYDASALEPASRQRSTYALQEYFVPVERFASFAAALRDILRRHDANVLNVSVRHVTKDPGSLLAWAREEVFGFVLYYKQGTDPPARDAVGIWARELIEAALREGGTFYLPYQPHATVGQFRRGYPRFAEFAAVKQRVDPANKFRNEFWIKYTSH